MAKYNRMLRQALIGGCIASSLLISPARSEVQDPGEAAVNLTLEVVPFAELTLDSNLLHLVIPPDDSTLPSSGVNFTVTGNASATLIAEPDAFILAQTIDGEQFLGRAVLNGNAVGYKLELRFPRAPATGGDPQDMEAAFLPLLTVGPTTPPLLVDLTATGNQRTGVLHMEADPNWTLDGGIPLPGTYVGQVTLTLTASD